MLIIYCDLSVRFLSETRGDCLVPVKFSMSSETIGIYSEDSHQNEALSHDIDDDDLVILRFQIPGEAAPFTRSGG